MDYAQQLAFFANILEQKRLVTALEGNASVIDRQTGLTYVTPSGRMKLLLEKEDIQPEKAKEYVDVLNRQAARLKKLTEDLVEASKASSGSLPVHLAPTDVNVLLSQLAGDYLEKLEAAQLEPVFHRRPSRSFRPTDSCCPACWAICSRISANMPCPAHACILKALRMRTPSRSRSRISRNTS